MPVGEAQGRMVEERRLLTILFADLSGFTALSSELDPEEVRETANLCFSYLNTAVAAQGGTVHKYEGDLVIALFGYPAGHEDDPERAIQASFAMFDLLPEINAALSGRLGRPTDLGLHAGINSGTVVVGEVGTAEKRETTVMGDAVNLASRLKDAARRGEVLVTEPVFRASRYLFEYEAREPVDVKGIARPVKVFRPLRRKARPEPKRGIHGLVSPLVGRDKELALLKQAVGNLEEGSGGALFLLGDAGLGKSRLWEELRNGLARERKPVILLEGRCLTYSESVPYWPVLQVLRPVLGIGETDDHVAVRERILERTKGLFPESWAEVAPYLGSLFSVGFEDALDEKVRYLDAQGLKTQIFISVRKLLGSLFRAQPLLLVVEDFQWMDLESLELMEFLLTAPEPFPMLLLALSRVEREKESYKAKERWRAKLGDRFQEVVLEPLSPEDGARMVHHILAAPGFPAAFRERVLAKAEGNPFYLEEIIRSLIDAGVLVQEAGVWSLASDVEALAIPDNVQAVIASRLDILEKDVREVLQMAAVIGRNFRARVLERLAGLVDLMLVLYLADLEEHDYIREYRREPDLEYLFRHPLIQEVAYNGLLRKQRRELHRRCGEVIEELYRDRLEDVTEALAHQYAQGDDLAKALEWLKKAGEKARGRFANDEAIAWFERTVALLKIEAPERVKEIAEATETIGDIYHLKGDYEAAGRIYQDLGALFYKDPLGLSRSKRKLAGVLQSRGKYREALPVLDEAAKLLTGDSLEDYLERAQDHISRSRSYRVLGDLERAIFEGEKGLTLLGLCASTRHAPEEIQQIDRIRGRGLMNLGAALSDHDDLDRAIGLFNEYLSLSEKRGDKVGIGQACNHLGNAYHIKGEFQRSLALYQRYLDLSREIGQKQGIAIASNNMGFVYQDLDENARSMELYRTYIALSEEMGYRRGVAIGCGNIGELDLKAGELEKSEEQLRRAEQVFQEMGDKNNLSWIWRLLAEKKKAVADRDGTPDTEAWLYADRAWQLAVELGSKEAAGNCLFTNAKLQTASRKYPEAEGQFQKALEVFRELKNKKPIADISLAYGRMLRQAQGDGVPLKGNADEVMKEARALYQELKLPNKAKECY